MRGIKLEGKKESTLLVWTIRRLDPPKKVRISLRHSKTAHSKSLVKPGDRVKTGEKIAEPADSESAFVHSSVTGLVTAVQKFSHPSLGHAECIEIETDLHEQKAPNIGTERRNWETLEREDLLEIFLNAGVIDLNASEEILHVKARKKVRTVFINACESEPYLTGEHALMMSHPLEILKGIELLRRVNQAQKAVIVIQDNKLEVAETLKSKIFFMKSKDIEVEVVASLYPPQFVTAEKVRLILPAASPVILGAQETGAFEIYNVASAFAVYEAAALQKPFYERTVTVAGECVIEPKNIWARIGMDLESAVKAGKGFLRPPRKILMGGPLAGIALESLQFPVTAGTQGVLGLPDELTPAEAEEPCIRCGACVEVCPSEIHPAMITLAAERNLFQLSRSYGAQSCVECGNCGYVCPSKRSMLDLIRRAKSGEADLSGKKRKRRRNE